jgi:hypothetical protein
MDDDPSRDKAEISKAGYDDWHNIELTASSKYLLLLVNTIEFNWSNKKW